jgi:hypothetical protein
MTKTLIAIFFFLIGVSLFMWVVGFYDRTARPRSTTEEWAPATPAAGSPGGSVSVGGHELPGMPPHLEPSLAQAHQGGAEELGKWLRQWGRQVQDPRLAWIELDYVVLLNLQSHKAARERFQQVQARIAPGSPVYDRLQKLASAYEQ